MVKSRGKNSEISGKGERNDLETGVVVCEEIVTFPGTQGQSYLGLGV